MPAVKALKKSPEAADPSLQSLKSEVEYRTHLQEIGNKINAAANLDEILIDLKDEITTLLRLIASPFTSWTEKSASWCLVSNRV